MKLFAGDRLFCAWYSTSRCNSNCATCSTHKIDSSNELSTAEAERLIDQTAACGIRFFNIFGGEPLLREDMEHLANYSIDKGLKVIFSTNGILIDKHIDWLSKSRKLITTVSMDAMDRETYKRIRGVDAFDRVMENVKALNKRLPPYNLRLFTTISPLNFRQAMDIVGLCERERMAWLGTTVSSGAKGTLFELHDEEARPENPEFAKELPALLKKIADKCRHSRSTYLFSGFYEMLIDIAAGKIIPCAAVDMNVAVMNNGDVSNCFLLPPFGNIRKEPLKELLKKGSERERQKEVEECYKRGHCTMSCVYTPVAVRKHPIRFAFESMVSGRIIELAKKF